MMEEKKGGRSFARVLVPEYLARWSVRKFEVDSVSGGIRIPPRLELYRLVWQLMEKRPVTLSWCGKVVPVDDVAGNLVIQLPCRRGVGGVRKNPLHWNYLSERSGRIIGRELKRLFDLDFHSYMDTMPAGVTRKECVRQFCRQYGLGIDAEDTLVKNLQRRRQHVAIFLNVCKNQHKIG